MSFKKVVGLVLLIILIYDKQTQHQWLRKICTLKKIQDGRHYNKNAYISGTAGAFFIILFLLVKAHPGDNFLLQDKVLNLPWLFFLHIHTLLQYYYIVLEIFPRPGLKLLSSQRVCSFLLICLAVQDQGCFSSSNATIWALTANFGLLAPLLVNLLESGSPA